MKTYMKNLFFSLIALLLPLSTLFAEHPSPLPQLPSLTGEGAGERLSLVASEGAWCWFADPRALHYENEGGTINATYLGYIDVHGNVKATQYDWVRHRKTDVLIRSYFQPDDHNNPTFVVLPDERVMIFYTRHTDEPKIWYRISRKPGDITDLGEEKYLATANNTTYPSPFILSDDPDHIYLCWRGINWHPTIARITQPDANDNCQFDFGPKQIVQSTGARPYAKYQSNGKDKIYLSYTTGHPDNEMPDWLYFNVIDINHGNGPILRDIKGTQLKKIADGAFNVNKQSSYASSYPYTIVDKSDNIRNWVWQVTLDKDENPVIAYPHIDNAKTTHVYWYARWTGTEWRRTWVQYGGHAFHQNWNQTERCYSGGMSIDPDNINDLYLSIPTKDGAYDKDGVYEIWRYTIDDEGNVAGSEQITSGSTKNNVRPFIIPGSKNSPLRLGWMNGDYYYWMVQKNYPKGYPTSIYCDYEWQENVRDISSAGIKCICLNSGETLFSIFAMNQQKYEGILLTSDDGFTYSLGADGYPVITINGTEYKSQNRLYTSDDWATNSTGTSGDNHPTKLSIWYLTLTYDGKTLTSYRNGLVDQVIEVEGLDVNIQCYGEGFNHTSLMCETMDGCATPLEVQKLVADNQERAAEEAAKNTLKTLTLPAETRTDLVLPSTALGQDITWSSSNPDVISADGVLATLVTDTPVTLTATIGSESRSFEIKALARDITKNLRYTLPKALDLTANTASGFASNSFGLAPEGLLSGLRSYTVILSANIQTMTKQPRFYDFGGGSGNSLFLRADALSAGIKYNNGTTTMLTSSTKLQTGKDYKLAVTYDAATRVTRIYIDGEEDVSGTAVTSEPYMIYEAAGDARNYIGRTQWWDGSYSADNQDLCGTVAAFSLYDVCLTRKEICELQGLPFEDKEYPTSFVNGDFEADYSAMTNSGVTSDRAIYIPEGWTLDYSQRDPNDLTALTSADQYYGQFFASKPQNGQGGAHTLWIRQRWNPSTLNFYQEVCLPAGTYKLTADIFATDNSANNTATVYVGRTSRTVTATNQWQTVTFEFQADGSTPLTIGAKAEHQSSEFICAFDNFTLTRNNPDGVETIHNAQCIMHNGAGAVYDLSGRRVNGSRFRVQGSPLPNRGGAGGEARIYINNGKKVLY